MTGVKNDRAQLPSVGLGHFSREVINLYVPTMNNDIISYF